MNLAKGTVNDLSKLSSLTYFMLVAKKMYVEMGLGEEADKLTKLSDEWDHWVQVSKEIERKKNSFDFYSFLSIIDVKLSSSFMYMKIDNEDYKIRSMAVSDKDMYKEYIINLLDLKQRELLYEILGIIWLNIHTNKQLSLTEIRQIVERSKIPEAEKLPEDADTTLVVDDAIDAEKVNFTPNAPDSTPLGFKKALRIIMPVIDIFKDNFYKDTELKTRCNNAEVYAFSVLITASKIMYTDENVVKLLKQAYQICKNVHNYYLVRVLSKWKTMNSFLIDHFESKYEITLSSLILEMFEKAENLIESIQRSTGESFAAGDIEEIEEGKRRILNYKRTKKELDPKHFVGWIIKHDDLTTITEILRSGEPIVTYDVEADPYHLKFSDLPSISLILGQTGCLSKDTKISIITDNGTKVYSIKDVYNTFHNKPFNIFSFNFENKIIEKDTARVLKSGKKKLFKITLNSGKIIKATGEHIFFRKNKARIEEIKLSDLKVDDELMVV